MPVTTAVTPAGSPTTSTPETTIVRTGDLANPTVLTISVGGRRLTVALADTPATRSRGLMEVDDLGDLDGMLFDLGSERMSSFTMRNTLIPLDIYFFDSEGREVGRLEMVPCDEEPCPSYSIDRPARFALEIPAASLDISEGARLELG